MQVSDVAARAVKLCGHEPVAVSRRQSGYRNHSYRVATSSDLTLNFIIYKREPDIAARIRRANLVSDYLWIQGLPARHTIEPRIIRLSSDRGRRYACVYEYLPGTTIEWEAYTRTHLKLLGKTMSDMHAALSSCPHVGVIRAQSQATDQYRLLIDRMERYFMDPNVDRAAKQKLGVTVNPHIFRRLRLILAICDRLPHQQIIHLDFVRGNLLFQDSPHGPNLTGILDFEKTAYGPPVLDIARTLAFLLVDSKYKTPRQVRKYFLLSGYNKRGLTQFRPIHIHTPTRQLDLLEELLGFFLFHDFYKFLRHNPYESLHANNHYRRTHAALEGRGALRANRFASTAAEPV